MVYLYTLSYLLNFFELIVKVEAFNDIALMKCLERNKFTKIIKSNERISHKHIYMVIIFLVYLSKRDTRFFGLPLEKKMGLNEVALCLTCNLKVTLGARLFDN